MRLFVAADLPRDVCESLAARGRVLEDCGGWRGLDAASIHVTLAFLAERPEQDVKPIASVLSPAWRTVGGLRLGVELRLPPRRPRVAAVAIEDPRGELAALQGDVAAGLTAAGLFTPERRAFLPHATVARRRSGPAGAPPAPTWDDDGFGVVHLTLYASQLSPRGASYEAIARVPDQSTVRVG